MMLPAISAELPAYLLPPTTDTANRTSGPDRGFGPAATVELSADAVRTAQSRRPGVGLYGPNGRFVEPQSSKQGDRDTRPTQTETTSTTGTTATENASANAARTAAEENRRNRELSLSQIDASVPPAQQQELRALAKRVERTISERPLQVTDYKQIANLMERVGRFDQAKQALEKAKELESGSQSDSASNN